MNWKKMNAVAASLVGLIAIAGATMPIIRSDASPWSSVARVESVRSEILAMHLTLTWSNFCEAERMKNRLAMQAVSNDVENLEQQYAKLNDGRELPLRPCP